MDYMKKPVAYLEDEDIDNNGNISNEEIPSNVPMVVMVQTSWCPHCVSSKPAFQEFANRNDGKVFCATIQADGVRDSEKRLGKRAKTLYANFRGFPHYVLYKNGKVVPKEIKGRDVVSLEEFAGV